mgnify:CR=1 FL=1
MAGDFQYQLNGLQGFLIIDPFPEQETQVLSSVKKPCCVRTLPDPPQLPHVALSDPLEAPVPLQSPQAILALTFKLKSDYEKILEDDMFEFLDLNNFSPGVPLKLEIKPCLDL